MKMEKPLVSVVITVYNKAKYIRACVDSVLAQTYPNIEILIVDDCSTDNSREVISSLADKYPQVHPVFLEKNGGVSHARNVGIIKAAGGYVTYLDADDFYYNEKKLENEMSLIAEHSEEDVVAYSLVQEVDNDGLPLGEPFTYALNGDVFFGWMKGRGDVVLARDYCVKKETIIEAGLFEEGCSFYEDLDLLYRLALRVRFFCTNEIGSAYRFTPDGLSKQSVKRQEQAKRSIRNRYMKNLTLGQRLYVRFYWFALGVFRMLKRIMGKM